MEREANLPPAQPSSTSNLNPPILAEPHSSRSFTSSSSSLDFLRDVQAALKRHRPLGTMQSSSIRARRILVPQREPLNTHSTDANLMVDTGESQELAALKEAKTSQQLFEQRKSVAVVAETPDDSSITPPSITGTITKTHDGNMNPFDLRKSETTCTIGRKEDIIISPSNVVNQHVSTADCQKKVQFVSGETTNSKRVHEQVGTTMDNLSSHMGYLALTEMELDVSNRGGSINDQDPKQRDFQQTEMSDVSLRSDDGISSLLAKRNALMQDQHHQFDAFLGKDPMTQSSVVASSCMTTTSVHSRSAPMLNSTTHSSYPCQDSNFHKEIESVEEFNVNPQSTTQGDQEQPSWPTFKCTSGMLADPLAAPTQLSHSAPETQVGNRDNLLSKGQQGLLLKESDGLGDGIVDHAKSSSLLEHKSTKVQGFSGDVTEVQSQAPLTNTSSSSLKLETSKSVKPEKAVSSKGPSAPRKKNYDPELFFKVNGKLYQKLGKIGSGGSSEVYKVITSDCTIYALKRIKLKGRDYSTAYGFCQEIEYLNKLKGKNNIIQLIDYEVTDKTLLEEVLNGSMSIKDGRIRDDGYIYMILEYGEIDLAHMLSLKWKEMDGSSWNTDENWLRFYWQQILQAVSTIHEERIVHSDLKPANFLLVRGSLKLIDFGIAKAILSDTTNIQRDSQVGTLSYMSPEAFMCNENDANGNAIKCGRPSDIWSLGCILYQMVYGRTPFSEYKTFWAKFKVITDRNHCITYRPITNLWLLDLMKKCLAWDRNERWRIPQLLHHPFLVPPIPTQLSSIQDRDCKLLHQIAEVYRNDHEASRLCSQLQQLVSDSATPITSLSSTSRDRHCVLLLQMSRLCSQLQQHLANLENR